MKIVWGQPSQQREGRDPVFTRRHILPNKMPGARYVIPPFELLVTDIPEILKAIHTTDIVLGCLLELNGKTLLLKTPHT